MVVVLFLLFKLFLKTKLDSVNHFLTLFETSKCDYFYEARKPKNAAGPVDVKTLVAARNVRVRVPEAVASAAM